MALAATPIGATAAPNNYPDRTVGEYMECEQDVDKDAIVTDIAGRIELGPEFYRFDKFLQDLARHIDPNVSLIESGKGIELLSKVLERLAPEILNRHDISAVTHLFQTRIENAQDLNFKANIKDVANSLRYLSQMSRFMKNEVLSIMEVFFSLNETLWSQQTAPTRNAVYTLLIQLTSAFETELMRVNDMGNTIIDGMTKLAAPEKDPSNLKLILPFWVTMSSDAEKWHLSHEAMSQMWDSFSRYFPIVIRGTDQARQTSLVMKDLLRQCFLSSSAYSEWAFPRLVDGLDDLSADVKNDVLSTMAACIEKYDTPTVQRKAKDIYNGVKYEILAKVQDPALIENALSVIKALAARLITDLPPNSENPRFVNDVFHDLRDGLTNSDKDREKPGKIFAAVASSGPVAFEYIVKVCMPSLLTIKQNLETTEKKADMMRVFNLILEACPIALKDFDARSVYRIRAMDALLKFRNRLMDDVYIESMLEKESGDPAFIAQHVLAIQGFGLLYSLPLCIAPRSNVLVDGQPTFDTTPFLSEYYRGTIIESLNSILLSNLPQNAQVYEAALDVVQKTAMQDSKIFGESTLKGFLIAIPESVSSSDELEIIIPKLDALTRIACSALPLTTCFPAGNTKALKRCQAFLIFCQSLIRKVQATTLEEGQADYSTAIIAALFNGMLMFDAALDSEYPGTQANRYDGVDKISATGPFAETVMALYQLCVVQKQSANNGVYVGLRKLPCGEFFSSDFLFLVAKCATLAARSKHTPRGSVYPQEIWTLFTSNQDIPKEATDIHQGDCALGPPDKCAATILSLGLLAGIRSDEVLNFDPAEIALMMIANATSDKASATFETTLSFIYILQLVINKFGAAKKKLQDGTTIVNTMRRVLSTTTTPIVDRDFITIYQTLSYMASAALQAFDPAATECVQMMLEGLTASYDDVLFPVRSQMVARSFRVLLSPSEIICEKNNCKLRPLAKQKLYNLVVPTLLKLYPQVISNPDQRQAVLVALAAVLTNLPLSMYQSDAARLIPLVIAGTDVENAGDDDKTKVEAIDILIRLIPQEPKLIEEHLDSIIKRMTDRTHNTFEEPSDASQTCRCKALLCLATLATYVNPEAIIKRKFSVMKELGIALNDVSRPVRHAAVRTKFVWFNVQVNEALAE